MMFGTAFLGMGAKPQAIPHVKQLFAPALRFLAPLPVDHAQLAIDAARAFEHRMNRIWPAMHQWPAPEEVDDAWRMWVARVAFDAREDAVDNGGADNDIEVALEDAVDNGDEDDHIEDVRFDDGSDGETTLVDDDFYFEDTDEKDIEDVGLTHSVSFDDTLLRTKALLVPAGSTEDIHTGSASEDDAQALVFPTLNFGSKTSIGKDAALRADAPAFVPKAAAGPPALRADAPAFVPKGARSALRAAAPVFVPRAG